MATVAHALTTKEKVKTYLGISGTEKDAVIDQLIGGVTAFIEGYCGGRRFKSTSYVEIKDGGKSTLFLDQHPVTALTAVEYKSGTVSDPVWNTYDENSYEQYLAEGYLKFYGKLPDAPRSMRVTYTAGYLIDFTNEFTGTHTLPFDLTMVATELAAKAVNNGPSDGIISQSTEGQTVQFDSATIGSLSRTHRNILDKYKTYRM